MNRLDDSANSPHVGVLRKEKKGMSPTRFRWTPRPGPWRKNFSRYFEKKEILQLQSMNKDLEFAALGAYQSSRMLKIARSAIGKANGVIRKKYWTT
jgi:hypothetical protein